MIINDPDGTAASVTSDKRLQTVAVMQTDINALVGIGKAWTLPLTVTAADATDNVVWHFKNTSSDPFDIMRLIVSSTIAGVWTLESGRSYSANGTAMTLAQLNTSSGKTQSMTAYYGTDITLTGTAVDLYYWKTAADTPYDILQYGPILVGPSGEVALKFNADSGTPIIAVTPVLHGANPWE